MDRVYLRLSRPDLVVRDPITLQPLPADGAEVELTTYWIRRIADGDVVREEREEAPTADEPTAQDAPFAAQEDPDDDRI